MKSSHSRAESKLQSDVLDYLQNEIGGYWIKLSASAYQTQGEPDIIGCCKRVNNGQFIGIELKREDGGGRASALQKYKNKLIKNNGGVSMIINNLQELKDFFNACND